MQRAVKYLLNYYSLPSITELYAFIKEEIEASAQNYFPNPLLSANCIHLSNAEHPNLRVVIEGTLDLIGDEWLYSTCFPKTPAEGTD